MVTPVTRQSFTAFGTVSRLSPVSALFHVCGVMPASRQSAVWLIFRASRINFNRFPISTALAASDASAII